MADGDFEAVVAIAAERPDITIFLSSTPTGRRSFFYEACTNKELGYKEFYFPSMVNPNWGPQMESEFRNSLPELGYIHEVLAEFGPQETGVFNKQRLDEAIRMDLYAYEELNYLQKQSLTISESDIKFYIPAKGERGFYPNRFRAMGVDWDKKIVPPSRYTRVISVLIAGNPLELYVPERNNCKDWAIRSGAFAKERKNVQRLSRRL